MLHQRIPLIFSPTPLHRLDNMSKRLSIDLWAKQDDLTGFAGGGNKGRKLEFIVADAIARTADSLVAAGASQSNFLRQCAAACSVHGLEFHAVTMDWPSPGHGREAKPEGWKSADAPVGNAMLLRLFNAQIHKLPDGGWSELANATRALAIELETMGKRVCVVPVGGSSGVGALGFVRAAQELLSQATDFDYVVVASGSGGTQAGLAYEFRRASMRTVVVGVCSDNEPEVKDDCARVASELDALLLGKERMQSDDFVLRTEFSGIGYQAPTTAAADAIRELAQTEGIFLDPVYTGKAFAGLIKLVEVGELAGKVLFWHTGGFPGLFVPGYV